MKFQAIKALCVCVNIKMLTFAFMTCAPLPGYANDSSIEPKGKCHEEDIITRHPDLGQLINNICQLSPQEIYELAIQIRDGHSVKKDYDIAHSLFLRSSAKGVHAAAYQVYKLVIDGKIKSLNHVKEKYAIPTLQGAALACHPMALKDYGLYILKQGTHAEKYLALSYLYQARNHKIPNLDKVITDIEKDLSKSDLSQATFSAKLREEDCNMFSSPK